MGIPDVGELRLEVDVAVGIALVGDDLSAHPNERLGKILREADRVVVAHVLEDGGLRQFQIVVDELGHHISLEGIDEAGAEDVIAHLRHLGIGGGGRDHRNFVGLRLGSHEERAGRGHFAEKRDHVLAGDQPGRRRGRLLRLALVVEGDDLDLLAPDAARRVELGGGELDGAIARHAESRFGSRHRAYFADHDGALAAAGSAATLFLRFAADQERAKQQSGGDLAHRRLRKKREKAALLNTPLTGEQAACRRVSPIVGSLGAGPADPGSRRQP